MLTIDISLVPADAFERALSQYGDPGVVSENVRTS
jgi:hypothetical protein